MAVNGKNYGSVYQETFGTTSPVSGSAPTDPADGQPMDGLFAVRPVVSAAVGVNLSGAGTLQAYILDTINPAGGRGTAASSDATTVTLNESGITDGFAVGQTVRGTDSGASGVIASIGGGGNTVLTCSGGVTGTFKANEVVVASDVGTWVRCPALDTGTVPSGAPNQTFAEAVLSVPRKGRIKWVPNGVTFASGSAGVTVTQLGQTNNALHDAGRWS